MAFWDRRPNKGAKNASSADAIEPIREQELGRPPGDRAIPPVNPRSYQSRGQIFMFSAAVLVLLALMWRVNGGDSRAPSNSVAPKQSTVGLFDKPAPSTITVVPPKPPEPIVPEIKELPKSANPSMVLSPYQQAPGQPIEDPLTRRMKDGPVVYDTNAAPNAGNNVGPQSNFALPNTAFPASPFANNTFPLTPALPAMLAQAGQPAGLGALAPQAARAEQGTLGEQLSSTRFESATASRIPDPTTTIAKGKIIDCALDTAISTVVAGMVKCTLTRDVYGENGKLCLLSRGTELTGEYRSNLRDGQSRIGIVWTEAKTPDGVLINLTSPATDSLGRAGVDGYLDTRFWQRYGASLLLSSIDDVLAIIANRVRDNGSIYIPPSTTRTGREAAGVALEKNMQIPPTIVKHQGEHIAVFVARNLDFSTVYGYRPPIS